jgi:hypothetical protein
VPALRVLLRHSIIFVLSLCACDGATDVDAGTDAGRGEDAGAFDAGALDGGADGGSLDAGSDAGPSETRFVAVDTSGRLVQFELADPDAVTTRSIDGLGTGETIVGIDVRPANGALLALSSQSRVFRIELATGAATLVGGPFDPPLSGATFAFDVNPSVDRIRVFSDTAQSLRLNPDTGMVAVVDSAPHYVPAGTVPAFVGAAYTPAEPLATTSLYAIDATTDALAIVTVPNSGDAQNVGALGVDAAGAVGFDIAPDGTAYASITMLGTTRLYTIDLTTGGATDLGAIGGAAIVALAVLP